MSASAHHLEWLSLVEASGPFLSLGVLDRVFPQGLPALDKGLRRRLAESHQDWLSSARAPSAHHAWIELVTDEALGLAGHLAGGQDLPAHLRMDAAEHGDALAPDRFPFLEGRRQGTSWRHDPAEPLPIHDGTVLHLLDALQVLRVKTPGRRGTEARQLSFRALDVEQIGHVYEGLLDHTCRRAADTVLGLRASAGRQADVALTELDRRRETGDEALVGYLKGLTGRQPSTLQRALDRPLDVPDEEELRILCGAGQVAQAVVPYGRLLRRDPTGELVVVPKGSVYVTEGTDRRSSGTHYTPRGLAEEMVRTTLEPLVYEGPAVGWERAR